MRTFYLKKDGGGLHLTTRETATPTVGPREVLVRVRAASLNKRDLFILNGSYPMRPKTDVIPLSDGAGEIVETSSEVSRFKVGDRVAGNYFARWTSGPLSSEVFDQLGCTLNGWPLNLGCLMKHGGEGSGLDDMGRGRNSAMRRRHGVEFDCRPRAAHRGTNRAHAWIGRSVAFLRSSSPKRWAHGLRS
jgi:hypothetical protein